MVSLSFLEKLCKKPVIPRTGISLKMERINIGEKNFGWLDKQEENSAVYIAFGSEVTLSKEELAEIAMGLQLSGLSCFWTLKMQNNPSTSELPDLPDWFEHQTIGRSIVWTNWAPQLRILAHKSLGGFLSHCGCSKEPSIWMPTYYVAFPE